MRILEIEQNATILILEDSIARRRFFLSQYRLPDAILAFTSSQAIALLKGIAVDVVMLDWNLEGTYTTAEAARWIADNNYAARIVSIRRVFSALRYFNECCRGRGGVRSVLSMLCA